MAIFNDRTVTTSDGIKKSIDSESHGIALDILQRGIYAYPIPSTIRELASNAYDAINERNSALKILSGEAKVEDFFDTELVDGIYHSSGWDPDYFDPAYLSKDNNVYITYEEGKDRDTLRIKDNGVGLGKGRMTGYFQLAYSSKRSQKGALGKFGLGSKAALSMGIDSFTVISRYNGKKFKFEVYLDTVVSTTPKFSDGKANDFVKLMVPQMDDTTKSMVEKEFIFYYEATEELNGLELRMAVKKHNKEAVIEAIESQLMYVPNVVFRIKYEKDISYTTVDIAAKVLYRDENIIISESTVFDKPHLLLGTGDGLINYGLVAFKELELEPKRGAVGFIMNINDVEITPSRESVIWSPKTRAAILESYNKVVETATRIINAELRAEIDYFSWVVKAATVRQALSSQGSQTNSTLSKLSGIIDTDAINRIVFSGGQVDKVYSTDMDSMFGSNVLLRSFEFEPYSRKITRTKIKSPANLPSFSYFVITENESDKYRDRYIYEHLSQNKPFLHLKLLPGWKLNPITAEVANSPKFVNYDSIVVPQDIMDGYLLEESDQGAVDDEESTTVTIDANRLALLRKQNQEVLYHVPRLQNDQLVYTPSAIKKYDIASQFQGMKIVYATFDDRSFMDSIMRMFPKYLLHCNTRTMVYAYRNDDKNNVEIQMKQWVASKNLSPLYPILVSKEVVPLIKGIPNFQHISDFVVKSYNKGVLEFSDYIKLAVTMHFVTESLADFKSYIDVDMILDKHVQEFVTPFFSQSFMFSDYFRTAPSVAINGFLKEAAKVQLKLAQDADTDIEDEVAYLNTTIPECLCDKIDDIKSIKIIDTKLIETVQKHSAWLESYKPLLKTVRSASSYTRVNDTLFPLITPLLHQANPAPEPYEYF